MIVTSPKSSTVRAIATLAAVANAFGCFDLGSREWVTGSDGTPDASTSDASLDDGSIAMDSGVACPRPGGEVKEAIIEMVNNRFVPASIDLCVGDTVVWKNRDPHEHKIVSGTPEERTTAFVSGLIYLGQEFRHTFETAGDFIYFCSTHKTVMRDAWIHVR